MTFERSNLQYHQAPAASWSAGTTLRSEQNVRIQLAVSIAVVLVGGLLGVTKLEWLFLITAIRIVISLELLIAAISFEAPLFSLVTPETVHVSRFTFHQREGVSFAAPAS